MPDYGLPREGESYGEVFPNLLAHIDDDSVNTWRGYYPDESRTCSVRFVGLFDTVGSFYQAGDNEEGRFQLGLDVKCAERVFQISAHHEYRKNFPLTSLRSSQDQLYGHFYEEVFAGAIPMLAVATLPNISMTNKAYQSAMACHFMPRLIES